MDDKQAGPGTEDVRKAARLCLAVYAIRPSLPGWRAVSMADLGLPPAFADGPAGRYSHRNAAAFVHETMVGGERTLALVFRGTDVGSAMDWADNVLDINRHYDLMRPLVRAVDAHARRIGASRILVAGHSLGGAMATLYMAEHADRPGMRHSAVTFGSPGARLPDGHSTDLRMLEIRHAADPVPKLGALRPFTAYRCGGRVATVDDQGRHGGLVGAVGAHRMRDYLSTVEALSEGGALDLIAESPGDVRIDLGPGDPLEDGSGRWTAQGDGIYGEADAPTLRH